MVPRAYDDIRLIVHKPNLPVVDDTPHRRRIVRILNRGSHFLSLRDRV